MLGVLFIVGLAIALAGLETLVRRLAGHHPHHAATPAEAQRARNTGTILPDTDGGGSSSWSSGNFGGG